MTKPLNPCIGVCKYLRDGPKGSHCVGCSMTQPQKKIATALRKNSAILAFIDLVTVQQTDLGDYKHWRPAYIEKSLATGAPVPKSVRNDD